MHQTDRQQLRLAVAGFGRQCEVVVRFAGLAEIFILDAHGQIFHHVVTGTDAETFLPLAGQAEALRTGDGTLHPDPRFLPPESDAAPVPSGQ